VNIVAFKPAHLHALELQDAQAYLSGQITSPGYAESLATVGQSFTVLDGETVIGCGGCMEMWEGRAIVWAIVSRHAGRLMVGIHRAVAGFLSASKYRRIEAWVDEGFEPGMRWAEMLGFTLETPEPMRGFRPSGGACFLYAKVKHG